MTKRRTPESFEDAALEAAALMGPDHCGQVAGGITGAAVRKWTDPDQPGNPTLHQALAIDTACMQHPGGHGRTPFLHAYTEQLRKRTDDAARVVGHPLDELLDLPSALGVLTDAVRHALDANSDGGSAATPREVLKILEAIKAVRVEVDDLEAALTKTSKTSGRPHGPASEA